jgi:hypothetical protein
MLKTVEAVLEKNGRILLLENVNVQRPRRVLVTFLEEPEQDTSADAMLLSEPALSEDWSKPEEDAAWRHLQ